jgi:predicted phage terminase large subunit-like protein
MGSEIPLICFDELTRFSWFQFQYMLSRNRSTCGVRPYIRATCNPDKNSWVRKFIDWYIGADGYPIKERGGVIRYFIIEDDEVKWSDSPDSFGENSRFAKSFTFIPALLDDNKILMEKDPGYEANLMALSKVERERLRFGNWNIEPVSGEIFKRAWFPIIRAEPRDFIKVIRYWDRASSTKDRADFTAGVKMGVRQDGSFVVIHVEHFKGRPKEVWSTIKNLAAQDGIQCEVGLEKDPGQAGVVEVDLLISQLAGFDARAYPALVDKVTRANPVSAQCEIGNVSLLEGEWNEGFLRELEAFPDGAHDDQVDAFSGAFNVINSNKTGIFTDEMAQSEEIKEKVEW